MMQTLDRQEPRRAPKVKMFKAKYPGKCSACDGRIRPGQKITWTKTFGAFHAKCS